MRAGWILHAIRGRHCQDHLWIVPRAAMRKAAGIRHRIHLRQAAAAVRRGIVSRIRGSSGSGSRSADARRTLQAPAWHRVGADPMRRGASMRQLRPWQQDDGPAGRP